MSYSFDWRRTSLHLLDLCDFCLIPHSGWFFRVAEKDWILQSWSSQSDKPKYAVPWKLCDEHAGEGEKCESKIYGQDR